LYKLARRNDKNAVFLSNWIGHNTVKSKQQNSTENPKETPQTCTKIPKIKTAIGFVKSQKSVDCQGVQSQSDNKSEVICQPTNIFSDKMSKPASNQLEDQAENHMLPKNSCGNLEMDYTKDIPTKVDCLDADSKVQDFSDAPS